jgi:hypothetical protein
MRCETDGGVVTMRSAQHPRTAPLHAGHYIKNPRVYSLWEWLKVQLRIIR